MRERPKRKIVVCLILALATLLAADTHAEQLTIRIVEEDANVRLKPDPQAEIIKNPPLGSIFEVENKAGDWYEIRVRTEVGVLITVQKLTFAAGSLEC